MGVNMKQYSESQELIAGTHEGQLQFEGRVRVFHLERTKCLTNKPVVLDRLVGVIIRDVEFVLGNLRASIGPQSFSGTRVNACGPIIVVCDILNMAEVKLGEVSERSLGIPNDALGPNTRLKNGVSGSSEGRTLGRAGLRKSAIG